MLSFRWHLSLFLSTNIEEKYHNTFCRLSTFLKICGQNVDKQLILTIFHVDKILANPHKINYLPWHCLYFFPEPHVQWHLVLSIFIVFMVLMIFTYLIGQCRFGIYSICGIYNTYSIYHRMTNRWHCQHLFFPKHCLSFFNIINWLHASSLT